MSPYSDSESSLRMVCPTMLSSSSSSEDMAEVQDDDVVVSVEGVEDEVGEKGVLDVELVLLLR